ncbi:MAG: hypothetical protein ACPHCI_01620 [Solirubrobacterales bacterium]
MSGPFSGSFIGQLAQFIAIALIARQLSGKFMFRFKSFGIVVAVLIATASMAVTGCSGDSASSDQAASSEMTAASWTNLDEAASDRITNAVISQYSKELRGTDAEGLRAASAGGPASDEANTPLLKWLIDQACVRATAISGEEEGARGEYCGITDFDKVDVATLAKAPDAASEAAGNETINDGEVKSYSQVLALEATDWDYLISDGERKTAMRKFFNAHRDDYPDLSYGAFKSAVLNYGESRLDSYDSVKEMLTSSARHVQKKADAKSSRDRRNVWNEYFVNSKAVGMTYSALLDALNGRAPSDTQRVSGQYMYYFEDGTQTAQVVVEGGVVTEVNLY